MMATFSKSRYLRSLLLLIFLLKAVSANKSDSSFSFTHFGDESKVESKLALFGDSKVVGANSHIEICGSKELSAGRVFYKKPIKLVEGNPKRTVSFSTRFVFSMTPKNGDGLAFVVVPLGFPLDSFDNGPFALLNESKFRALSVEFDTKMDENYGDLNGNHVGIDLNNSLVSVKASNVSRVNLVLNSGEKMQAWIDYEASSKRLEIRLGKIGEKKPINPLLSCPIDLSRMWKEEEVLIGLSSSNGKNSTQKCDLNSWNFRIRQAPRWMHSEPLDPDAVSKNTKSIEVIKGHESRDCLSKVLSALVFGFSCGALGAFLALFVWTVFGSKRPVVPEDYSSKSVEFEPEEKVKVVVVKSIEDGKK